MKLSLDIANLADGYARGMFKPEDVIGEVYDRVAAQGERPVWISLRPRQETLARAQAAPRGPLYGIPFAVKDNIDVAGLATTCACPAFAYNPQRSATVVERLEAAGAIVIGKTNLDQFATGLVGTRSPYGIPSSVFNKDFISGGSSSGSAVAVASGLVSFALGTDTAGSGRVPAAFNNIVGLKPTKGLISTRGVVPACRSQDTVSIFALTAADASRVLSEANAFDPEDTFARDFSERKSVAKFPAGLKVGVPNAPLEFFGDAAAAGLYARSVSRAKELGAEIAEIDFTPFRQAASLLYQGPWVAERLAAIKDFATTQSASMHDPVRSIITAAEKLSAVDVFEGYYRLTELKRLAEREWRKMDMLLLPTAPATYTIADVLADPIRLNSNLGLYTNFVNLMDLSALAIPAGFRPDALPFGVTLIGRAGADEYLAEFGDTMHRALGDASLGATEYSLSKTPAVAPPSTQRHRAQIAVAGAHLSGQPLNRQLIERNARLVRTARTAAGYSFYALANTTPAKPGLIFDGKGRGGIEVEIWEMDDAAFGSFVGLIPAPLSIGTLALADGSSVKGFLCEAHAVNGALNITSFRGWRAWLGTQGATKSH
jgi:allophanate hydrolase